jgi:hypothetical protein
MSAYSDRYTVQELRDMGEKNRRHVLSDEKYNAFSDEILYPKKKLASDADKDVVVEKYGSKEWAKGGNKHHVKHS